MGSLEAEGSSPPAMAVAIDELKKGRQSAATLSSLLLDSSIAKLLLEEITTSISKAIAVLESGSSREQMDAQVDSPSSDVTSKPPGAKRKIQGTSKTANRKRGNPYSWRRVTSSAIEDGHTWRKYGQKEIFSAKHPRSYFRCSYKHDRGCKATRQVQKSEDDPFLYVITYFGEHTCDLAKGNNLSCREPCVINLRSNEVNGFKQEIPFSSFPHKKENEEEAVSNLTSSDSPSNCFEPSEIEVQKPSMIGMEPGWCDSLPGLNYSMTSNDLEFMDLEDIFSFDQDGFFPW